MAHTRQPRLDSGLGVQVKVLETFQGVPSSLGRGPQRRSRSVCISHKAFYKSFCRSQHHHKSINLSFTMTVIKNKSKYFWWGLTFAKLLEIHFLRGKCGMGTFLFRHSVVRSASVPPGLRAIKKCDRLRVRSHKERRCHNVGPTQSRISPRVFLSIRRKNFSIRRCLVYEKMFFSIRRQYLRI